MKFTDEELSRILSAHESDSYQLRVGGSDWPDSDWFDCIINTKAKDVLYYVSGCIIQVALLYPCPIRAFEKKKAIVNKFDKHYDVRWSSDQLLRWMEGNGLC
jgi:hypothetical protein